MSFEATVRRAVKALRSSGAPYLLTGAQALAVYGEPRTTRGVDVVIAGATPQQLKRLGATLRKSGFQVTGDLVEGHNTVFDARTPYRLDIKVKTEAEEAHELEAFGGRVRFTTPEAPLVVKLEYGSEQDLRDARAILVRKAADLDVTRLQALLRDRSPRVGKALRRLLREVSNRRLLERL